MRHSRPIGSFRSKIRCGEHHTKNGECNCVNTTTCVKCCKICIRRNKKVNAAKKQKKSIKAAKVKEAVVNAAKYINAARIINAAKYINTATINAAMTVKELSVNAANIPAPPSQLPMTVKTLIASEKPRASLPRTITTSKTRLQLKQPS